MDTVSTCIQPICVISRVQARINSINNFIKYKNKKKKGFKIKIFINCVHTCIILLYYYNISYICTYAHIHISVYASSAAGIFCSS